MQLTASEELNIRVCQPPWLSSATIAICSSGDMYCLYRFSVPLPLFQEADTLLVMNALGEGQGLTSVALSKATNCRSMAGGGRPYCVF